MLPVSFCVPQHFHAGLNEALMKRFAGRFFPLWLPIGRSGAPPGSAEMAVGTGGVAAHQRQIHGIARM
jgi:hypothetical protein